VSAGYRAVQWAPGKLVYDGVLVGLLTLYLGLFLAVTLALRPEITAETALIRALGTAALLLLHVVLAIGPLARLDRRFLPLLWNRRHLGVTMFLCALAHGAFSFFQFHALGDRNPLVSLLAGNREIGSLAQFPFQPLGAAALVILFVMAATSHDFWLANLTAPVWKALHMGVYLAYGLVVAHVALGALQDERAPGPAIAMATGLALILALHLAAAARERRVDRARLRAGAEGWVEVGTPEEIAEGRAKVVSLSGERVAVFRHEDRISALSNVCQHQNGPLGEGRILDGCVTCPWHGYQYRPEDGASPPPFTERVPTFRVRVEAGRIFVDPRPLPPGTRVEPARFDPATPARSDRESFFVGYLPFPERLKGFQRRVVGALAVGFAGLALLVGSSQRPLGSGEYEFGVESEVVGLLRRDPVPSLWVPTAAPFSGTGPSFDVVPLVGEGKHGAPDSVLAQEGRKVRLRGSWIRRVGERVFEVTSAERLAEELPAPAVLPAVPLGRVHLGGEIVDSKCWMGVMKPADGKSHKACAIRCISGGVPAAFVVRPAPGEMAVLWMVSPSGKPLGPELLDLIAEPVELDGELLRVDGRAVLVVDRADIRRADGPAS